MSAPALIAGKNAHFEAPRLQRSAYAMEGISPRVVHVDENQSQQWSARESSPWPREIFLHVGSRRKFPFLQPLLKLSPVGDVT